MLITMSISFMVILIAIITMLIASILSKKSFYDREKNSPFECGFDPKSSARMPFSLHFFLIAIIFLIFDVEIALLLPSILTLNFSNINMWILSLSFFIFILLLGLYHEWNQGALNWTN
uniref:NADH-ubiquinone oxidoreductase chain 3 n=1 Tax=Eumantispa harmandi TaxID=1593348 RepID=A0A1S5QYF4_9NEOP|nr:NADH dehydrogenase subunit 3 [Eumantispa harmandi]AMW67936.1 NADH dehydrogenase subunit 3 [Eumantispa harmandi]AYG51264.1 NADH dehydrogenase subunit 3 [Eumantispa harmandi]